MSTYRFLIIFLIFGLSVALPPQQPVIGIYTEDAEDIGQGDIPYQTYIAASYVKNIEMAGGQVVPLFYRSSKAQLEDILSKINGVFLPGGEMPIDMDNQWTSNLAFILQYANKQNEKGNPYPVWATCLSYEAIMYYHSGRKDNMTTLTEVFGQSGKTCPLIVKNSNSILLKSLNVKEYQEVTQGKGLMWFHHRWSITLKTYQETPGINKFWKLISTSKTDDGVQFVSTVEAFDYPYFMTQYHPQKNAFQWNIPATRTYNAISSSQKFINQFIKVARLNTNQMSEEELYKKIIYNYQAYLPSRDYDFLQVYLFDQSKL